MTYDTQLISKWSHLTQRARVSLQLVAVPGEEKLCIATTAPVPVMIGKGAARRKKPFAASSALFRDAVA
jgi:hypothetical protein